ncbi:hypothetical protein JW926_13250 [Candidatus Sumerlaeota bacterium]|nr:hypothetical protein [Candidatus Sumerlaeota bacterium]
MSLFSFSSFPAIKSGDMTLTFRLWDTCKLRKGKSYPVEKLGRILIKDARKIPISSISDKEAKMAGYKSSGQIVSFFQKKKPDLNTEQDTCFRIEFQYLKPEMGRSGREPRALSRIMLDKLDEKLKRLDRRAQGITYSAILKEMSKKSFSRINKLVTTFDCEFTEVRRKLNRLISERFVETDPHKRFHLTPQSIQLIKHRENKAIETKK